MTQIDVVNIQPNAHSDETIQDSEPSIAVNPLDPKQIVVTAFTPPDPPAVNGPLFWSFDGGFTWHLTFDVPGGGPVDQSVAFAGDGGELFGAFMRGDNQNLQVFRTADVTSPAVLAGFDNRANVDQPWIESRRVVGGPDDGKFRIYVGYNDTGVGFGVASASVDICLDGLAAAPVFTTVKLNPRPLGANVRDGFAIRPVAHADGTVYVAYEGWTAGTFTDPANTVITTNIVVARDDHWASGATPFTDLKDPGDGLAGRLVATNVSIDNAGTLGQERLNNDLAIAVDPRTSATVYVAWADNNGSHYTLRVRRSTDRGATWSDDLLTADDATMATLAINSRGVVGLMYQQLKSGKWETHFRRTTDDGGTSWDDVLLARTPADAPTAAGQPYLGDWARMVAVGTTFFGVFCANNTPDPGNFPSGVRFQRNRTTSAPFQLLGHDNTTVVAPSIDPFFFRVREGAKAAPPGTARAGAAGSLLISSAVALLAHKRLSDVVAALERKLGAGVFDAGPRDLDLSSIDVGPVAVHDTDRRVLALAKAAQRMFQAGPQLVDVPPGLRVGHGVGRFAIAGAAAFELPAYAELFARNGSWIADIVRRGTPDENLSKVVVPSSQFAVRAGQKAIGIVPADDQAQAKIQSFSMGMLSALASDVVVSPVLRGLQVRRTKRDWSRAEPAVDIGLAEERIIRNLLGGRDGAATWQGWWPGASEIPDALFDGYLQSLEEAYHVATNRPRGFADFEELFADAPPDVLDRDGLRHGYELARLDAQVASWGAGTWYLTLLPLLVTPVIGYALVRALPRGSAFTRSGMTIDERAVWEMATLGTGIGTAAPFGYSIYLMTQVPENREAFAEAIGLFVVRASLAIGSAFAAEASAGVRWGLLFTPLALTDVYSLIRGLIEEGRNPPAGFVFLLQTLPVLTGSVVAVWSLLSAALIAAGADDDVVYGIMIAALALVLLLAVGLPVAIALSHGGGLRSLLFGNRLAITESLAALTETGGPAALAALFDDSTLWVDPEPSPQPPPAVWPTLAQLRYPAGRRALLRIWWTGAGGVQVSHDEHTVTFKKDDNSTKDVVLPPGNTSPQELARLLMAQMPGLQAEAYDPGDPGVDLPYPHTLADPGDTQATIQLHDAHVHDFAPVGTSVDEAYVLRHTPRDELVTLYGDAGPSRTALDALEVVPSASLGDLEQSALGTAADLAALLCMAAAPSLAGNAPGAGPNPPAEVQGPLTAAPAPGSLGPVFQVFRQWNLDERRVNEWRLLVTGDAERDTPDPVHADPGMRPDPTGAAYVNVAQNAPLAPGATAPETIARALGWVPLWRAWSRVAGDITSDTAATTPMSYTPTIRLPDGTPLQPSNADLTNAMRFLLDLA